MYLTDSFHLPAQSAEIPAIQVEDDLSQRMNYAAALEGLEARGGEAEETMRPLPFIPHLLFTTAPHLLIKHIPSEL